jgi:hypothetical protein
MKPFFAQSIWTRIIGMNSNIIGIPFRLGTERKNLP